MRTSLALVGVAAALLFESNNLLAQQDSDEQSAVKIRDAIGTLSSLELIDGRLRVDESRWHEAAYPAAMGNPHEQLLADTTIHGMTFEEAQSGIEWQSDKTLSLYSAKKRMLQLLSDLRTGSDGSSLGKNVEIDFTKGKSVACFDVRADPYARVIFRLHRPEVRDVVIDDNPDALFRLASRCSGRVGLLSQNLAGRIHLVFDGGDTSVAKSWPDYGSMLSDTESFPPLLRSDLSRFAIQFPKSDSQSNIRVPPSNLQEGPLTEVRNELSQLTQLHLVEGRVAFDRQHWKEAADELAAKRAAGATTPRASDDPLGNDPFGGDPFGGNRLAQRRRSRSRSPLETLIQNFGIAIGRQGFSGGSHSGINTSQFHNPRLFADFLVDSESDRVVMSFVEYTRQARMLTIEEIPGETFSLLLSDPDYTILFVQDAEGRLRLASCDSQESVADSWTSYAEMRSSNHAGLRLLDRLLDTIGVTFPNEA